MITKKVLRNLKPQAKPYFLRSQNVKGLGIKINPSGSIKFIVETKHLNRSQRRTIGTYPIMTLDKAEKKAITVIKQIHTGYVVPRDLDTVLSEYKKRVTLKPSTLKN